MHQPSNAPKRDLEFLQACFSACLNLVQATTFLSVPENYFHTLAISIRGQQSSKETILGKLLFFFLEHPSNRPWVVYERVTLFASATNNPSPVPTTSPPEPHTHHHRSSTLDTLGQTNLKTLFFNHILTAAWNLHDRPSLSDLIWADANNRAFTNQHFPFNCITPPAVERILRNDRAVTTHSQLSLATKLHQPFLVERTILEPRSR